MSPTDAHAAVSRVAVVHVHDPRARWGVRASGVVRIIAMAEWQRGGRAAIDALAAIGPLPGALNGRVVVVRGAGGREAALVAAGPIDVVDVAAGDVLSLPRELADLAPQISAIIVDADASLSLLLELAAVMPPEVGEDLCPSRS